VRLHLLLSILSVCFIAGCATNSECYSENGGAERLHSIYVVRRGWHTGIAIATSDWPNPEWGLLDDFPGADYLEFGWGDERFYQAEQNTPWLATRAVLWPTSSVIHVIGFDAPLGDMQALEVEPVHISAQGLRRLANSIEREFASTSPRVSGPQTALAPAPNRFYKATRSFYFPRMCNWWIARHLEAAGCPIQPWTVVTASRVMREARGFGK
jgi:uncharacterized protein (TIGR02117 family)